MSNIINILEQCGLIVAKECGDEVLVSCPFHDDTNPSLQINLVSGLAHCFAGCFNGDIVSLLSRATGKSTLQIMYDFEEEDYPLLKRQKRAQQDFVEVIDPIIFKSLGWQLALDNKYLLNRGFSNETIQKWDIMCNDGQICVPLKDEDWDIVGFVYRNIFSEPKYEYNKGFHRKWFLMGLNHFHRIKRDKVIIVEGVFDCVWLFQNGYFSVGVLGSDISDFQADLLAKHASSVILCGDNDYAGRKLNRMMRNKCQNRGIKVIGEVLLDRYKDIQEVPVGELKDKLSLGGVS